MHIYAFTPYASPWISTQHCPGIQMKLAPDNYLDGLDLF